MRITTNNSWRQKPPHQRKSRLRRALRLFRPTNGDQSGAFPLRLCHSDGRSRRVRGAALGVLICTFAGVVQCGF